METYTIAEAARLMGINKKRLYKAVQAGRLSAQTGSKPGDTMTVTVAALKTAGFAAPSAAPAPASATAVARPKSTVARPKATVVRPKAAASMTPRQAAPPAPSPAIPEPSLIAHLERALEAAQAREHRLLDLLTQVTRPLSAAPFAATPPPAAARAGTVLPEGSLRQQILTALEGYPEGLAPQEVRTLLKLDREVRSVMKGMVRSGLLTRLEVGRYVVNAARARA